MSDHPGNADDAGPTTGVVEQLARDDVERKRFLKMAGKRMGAGAAATGLAAFIAACGSSSKSSTGVNREGGSSKLRRFQHHELRARAAVPAPPRRPAISRSSTTR